jgi:hypothetical protein
MEAEFRLHDLRAWTEAEQFLAGVKSRLRV